MSRQHDPARDRQMRYIAQQRRAFQRAGLPVISVDTKKKELVGAFRNAGRTWRQQPLEVLATDFRQDALGKAIPHGICDLSCNAGYIVVGTTHETPAFAIAAIRSWWLAIGRHVYPDAKALLIEADSGGANGNRRWLWKVGLQALANEFGLTITVTHYPTAASKWNPLEHRLFSQISSNWAGQPLLSFETVLKFVRATKAESGLHCRAQLDARDYMTGLKATPPDTMQINFKCQHFRPKYNYTISPHTAISEKVTELFPAKSLVARVSCIAQILRVPRGA